MWCARDLPAGRRPTAPQLAALGTTLPAIPTGGQVGNRLCRGVWVGLARPASRPATGGAAAWQPNTTRSAMRWGARAGATVRYSDADRALADGAGVGWGRGMTAFRICRATGAGGAHLCPTARAALRGLVGTDWRSLGRGAGRIGTRGSWRGSGYCPRCPTGSRSGGSASDRRRAQSPTSGFARERACS